MSDKLLPQSEIILYQTEDGRTCVQCRFENETLWLTQAQIAELFETTTQNVTIHLKGIFAEGELVEAATCKDYLQVRSEGGREVSRKLRHYRLEAILAVGFRVRSHRGTQFRQWAIGRLNEDLVKGFTMDDERLKNPPVKGQKDYFDEQLERIRDIRSSERRFYQKVLDIYATSVDYTPNTEMSQQFFATVQNKMHWAAHGQTAAEVIHVRVADRGKYRARNYELRISDLFHSTFAIQHSQFASSSNQSGAHFHSSFLLHPSTFASALPGRLFYSTQIPVCLWFCGKNNALDSVNDAHLFDGETELSLVA